MKVIAEFVDVRNGKRYLPGSGDSIEPALTTDQVARLKKAGCLAEGNEEKAPGSKTEKLPQGFDAMNDQDLCALVELHKDKVTVAADADRTKLIAALKAAKIDPA